MRAEGVDVVNFGAGEPDFDTPLPIKEAAKAAIDGDFTRYTSVSGIQELKEAIARKLKEDNSLDYRPSEICVSCGAKHALYNTFQVLCEEGDEVIIPSPYWVSYPEMVKLSGARPIFLKTDPSRDFKITPEATERSITPKTKAIILNSPSNPTGSVYTKDELTAIAKVASSHGIWVVSDEIYEKIIYDGLLHTSIASVGDDTFKKTILINGVSKAYSMTGWRIGYLAADEAVVAACSKLQSHSTSNPTSISQKAALAALEGRGKTQEEMVKEFLRRRDYMLERIERIEAISCNKPGGAFYLFCDISRLGMGSVNLAETLLKDSSVAVVPGLGFGWDTHIRLSFATSMEEIKKGMDRIEKWARR